MPAHPQPAVSTSRSIKEVIGNLTASPTIPIAYPAATPANPTERPAARCMKPLNQPRINIHHRLEIQALGHIRIQAQVRAGRRLHGSSDEHRNDETVDRNNTRHNHRDQRLPPVSMPSVLCSRSSCLHDQVRPECAHSRNSNPGLGCPIRCAHCCAS